MRAGMIVDAVTYVGIAVLTAFGAFLGTDDAAKYISPETLFWTKGIAHSVNGGLIALKMFRSEVFSKWKQEKQNGNGNGHAKTNGNGNGNGGAPVGGS